MGAKVTIPAKSNGKKPRDFDKDLYKERNLIEGMFNKSSISGLLRPVTTKQKRLILLLY
jgi:hypothetical protein